MFSYYSEMPIIVRRLLEKAEEEEEVSEAIDDETEEEQEGTENLDVIFVENHGQIAGHEDDIAQEETADEIQDTKSDTPGGNSAWWKALVMGAAAPAIQYEVAFSLFPVLAVVTDEPLFSFYALFEICSWKGSKTVIDAIVINFSKMMQALLLGLLFMYTWMLLGMVTLRAQHGEDLCSNMFQCFSTYVIPARFVHSPP